MVEAIDRALLWQEQLTKLVPCANYGFWETAQFACEPESKTNQRVQDRQSVHALLTFLSLWPLTPLDSDVKQRLVHKMETHLCAELDNLNREQQEQVQQCIDERCTAVQQIKDANKPCTYIFQRGLRRGKKCRFNGGQTGRCRTHSLTTNQEQEEETK